MALRVCRQVLADLIDRLAEVRGGEYLMQRPAARIVVMDIAGG